MATPGGDANPLEALLDASDDDDDRELDLAMSIIHDLDVSLLEPQSPTPSSCSASSVDLDDHLLTQSTDFSRASGISYSSAGDDIGTLMLAAGTPDDCFAFSLSAMTSAQPTALVPLAAAKPKRREKKCTYQNRRLEIRHLRDEVSTLETQIRKLKLVKSRRRRQENASASTGAGSLAASRSKLETENAELKAAILAQKAQLDSLIDRMQASKLLIRPKQALRAELTTKLVTAGKSLEEIRGYLALLDG